MSADFFSFALPMRPDQSDALVAALADSEVEYNGNAYCDTDPMPYLELLSGEADVSMCPNFAAFVALDRFVAQPAHLSFLDNHAFRWIPSADLAAFSAVVQILAACGLENAIGMVERGANGRRDLDAGLAVLMRAVARAQDEGLGLLLACMPM